MAGGGESLGGGGRQKRGSNSKRKGKKRLGFRLDMTPLVDITFLLLTFFMLTTSMITPQTMDLTVPREQVDVQVAQTKLFSIMLRADGKIFVKVSGLDAPVKMTLEEMNKAVVRRNIELKNECIVNVLTADNTPYNLFVQVLDQLNAAEADISSGLKSVGVDKRVRRFTVSPMLPEMAKELEAL